MRARLAETVVETSVGDVKIKKVICLHKKKVSRTEEDEEIKVLVREKSEQRGDFTRIEGGKMEAKKPSERRKAEKQNIFTVRRVAQRGNGGQKRCTGLLRLCRQMKIRSSSGFS